MLRRVALKSYIVFLYGEATHRNIRRLETLRIKRTKLLWVLTRATRRNIPEDTILHIPALVTINRKHSKSLFFHKFSFRVYISKFSPLSLTPTPKVGAPSYSGQRQAPVTSLLSLHALLIS
jgi:hypothetical protein